MHCSNGFSEIIYLYLYIYVYIYLHTGMCMYICASLLQVLTVTQLKQQI